MWERKGLPLYSEVIEGKDVFWARSKKRHTDPESLPKGMMEKEKSRVGSRGTCQASGRGKRSLCARGEQRRESSRKM